VIVYFDLVEGGPLDDAYVASAVDEVMMPLVRP
jgi:hypothetical protein